MSRKEGSGGDNRKIGTCRWKGGTVEVLVEEVEEEWIGQSIKDTDWRKGAKQWTDKKGFPLTDIGKQWRKQC